ncbi:unnamed protein product [Cylindrotheca closterium]|uniref:Uncharacterized protein n=1 Tax=Cylindrotheca closterium TaxID=2856 RepID=A0AAD2JIM1_9STRA|nr:unnamed protein product [Cylindrotheca closterium]
MPVSTRASLTWLSRKAIGHNKLVFCLRHSQSGFRFSSSDNPLTQIESAIDSLNDFSARLLSLSELVDKKHVWINETTGLVENTALTLPQVVLHSRDSNLKEFQKGSEARALVMETALATNRELRSLAVAYESLSKDMEAATQICRETPCGGASWKLDLEELQKNPTRTVSETTGNEHVSLDGMDSPCGQLQKASMEFLKTSHTTKPQVTMASRALLILQLAMDMNKPLRHVREHGTKEDNQRIRYTFESQVVPTLWLRSEEEYQQLLEIEKELGSTSKSK